MAFAESWEGLRKLFGYNDLLMSVVGGNMIVAIVFWGLNAILMTCDLTGRPRWILQYKVQQDQEMPIDKTRLKKAVKRVILNETLVMIPVSVLYCWLHQVVGCPSTAQELPSVGRFLRDFAGFLVVGEAVFYYSHRLFHYGPLYRKFHKTHHEWTAPVGVTAMYCHPLELIIANISPLTLGPIFMRSHMLTTWIWWGVAVASTTLAHSGYHFPLSQSNEFHDYHHKVFNQNYGSFGWLDRLHGTSDQFRQTVNYRRHKYLLSLQPMYQWIPEQKDSKQK